LGQRRPKGEGTGVRAARRVDLGRIVALDAAVTGAAKRSYWRTSLQHHLRTRESDRLFLVAETAGQVDGFIAGEIRAFEFGSAPCGWVVALAVDPRQRERGLGSRLFTDLCRRFRAAGIRTVRTMVSRTQRTQLSFFRSHGLTTGPYLELEKQLD
jgi:L-amino acid N-acyltransferase YncA